MHLRITKMNNGYPKIDLWISIIYFGYPKLNNLRISNIQLGINKNELWISLKEFRISINRE